MRIFNSLVFDGVVNGTKVAFSEASFNEVFGRADSLRFLVIVEDASGTTPALTVHYFGSNDEINWFVRKTILNAQDVSAAPVFYCDEFGVAEVNDAFGRIELVLDAGGKKANVKVQVCGRV